MVQSPRGMFEFSHAMMGFEDALMNYLLEPDAMYELLSAYTDWKIRGAQMTIDRLQPDIIVNFDDWGNKTQLFLPPASGARSSNPCIKGSSDTSNPAASL